VWRLQVEKGVHLATVNTYKHGVWGILKDAGSPDTTLAEPHPSSNTQQSKNNTANVVVQQHSRKLLKMDTLMPETCWVPKK